MLQILSILLGVMAFVRTATSQVTFAPATGSVLYTYHFDQCNVATADALAGNIDVRLDPVDTAVTIGCNTNNRAGGSQSGSLGLSGINTAPGLRSVYYRTMITYNLRTTGEELEFAYFQTHDVSTGLGFYTQYIIDSVEYTPVLRNGEFFGSWHRASCRFTIPASTQMRTLTMVVVNIVSPSSTGYFLIDDISLQYTTYSGGNVNGDPQFVGLRGQSYQVHGIDGAVYNLVSSKTTQVNSRFVFLEQGKCPIFDGIPARNCWAHPGSYLGAIGIQQIVDGVYHKLEIVAGSAQHGFASILLNNTSLIVGADWNDTDVFRVHYASSHMISVSTIEFTFTFENSDMFINQGVSSRKPLSQLTSHGLFGQTHRNVGYPTSLKYIAGEVDDYLISENDLFGVHFMYNQFES